jgi:predicted secreted protein
MRVSYEAALRQLSELSLITHAQRESLFAVAPLDIKRALGHGVRPVNGYADVWPVDERSNGIHLDVMVDDEVVVALPENPTTGFRWLDESDLAATRRQVRRDPPPPFGTQLANPSPASGVPSAVEPSVDGAENAAPSAAGAEDSPLQRVSDQYAPGWTEIDPRQVRSMRRSLAARSNASHVATTAVATSGSQVHSAAAGQATPGVGGTGRRWLHLQAEVTGTWSYVLQYASPYDPMSKPVSTFTIEATVRPAPVSENRRRLLEVDLDDDSPSPLRRGI